MTDIITDADLGTYEIDNYADTITSTDIIERIEEIEEVAGFGTDEEKELDEVLTRELDILRKLAEQGEDFADWEYGETLIHEDYFTEYYTELIQDTSDVSDWDAFPFRHIDWDAVADEGKQDYSTIDFDGQTYYIR